MSKRDKPLTFWQVVIFIFLLLTGVLLYRWFKNRNSKQKEIEEQFYRDCNNAVNEFQISTDFENGYFANFQFINWKRKYENLFNEIQAHASRFLIEPAKIELINKFLNFYNNGASIREKFNKEFVPKELKQYRKFFDNIEGRKLDDQQRTSIVTDEDNNIVIAGAGSGKTTTIIGKVNYVLRRYNVPANEVLLISFTDKSASTLAKRINIDGVDAKTFHKFGLDLIAEVEGVKPSIFDVNQYKHLLSRIFDELITDQNYLQSVTTYFTEYLKIPKPQEKFQSQGEYFQYLKDQNFDTYKTIETTVKGTVTFRKEVVKSIEECKIANFLYFNGVNYDYEKSYEFNTATTQHSQYKPDFTLTQNGDTVYLEHFALGRDGQVPPFFADRGNVTHEEATQKYVEGINWKRSLHNENGTVLIETYSYEMFEGLLYDHLTTKLSEAGIALVPKSPEEIWTIITKAAEDEVKSFIDLIATFITLTKSNNYSIQDVINKNKKVEDKFLHKRNQIFIDIIAPIYSRYQQELKVREEIDFNDMINKASRYIRSRQFHKVYSYVIIDEFQDISIGRYQLVKAIKETNPACKLFCVGDDWQSIYRFTGSDISLYKEFEKYFGFTVKSNIETTYRYHDPLIDLSGTFILKNSNQSNKVLRSVNPEKQTIHKIVYSDSDNNDDTLALKEVFDELIRDFQLDADKEVLVLSRFTFDINRIKNEHQFFHLDKANGDIRYSSNGQIFTAKFLTIHKAKGLEADHVIIINCNSGKFGLPSEKSDDPILNLLLSEVDQFENGEERRLFYVAMTRAKESVHFIANSYNQSKFITEIEGGNPTNNVKKCPSCKTANLVLRQGISARGRNWAFWGCSNFKYGCEHQEWIN